MSFDVCRGPERTCTQNETAVLDVDTVLRGMQDNCGHYTFTVPSDIAPGNYLIRAEVIGQSLFNIHSVPGRS